MRCLKCRNEAQAEGLCRDHFIETKETIFLDNSNWEDLGIVRWLKYMYPEHYRDNTPKEHLDVYIMLLELYDPRYKNKTQRMRELIAFREFAKTKIIFGFISYIAAHNDRKMRIKSTDGKVQVVTIMERLIAIFSETGGMAEEFVTNIRDEFSINNRLKYFYHFTIQDAREDDTGQWTKRAFKINNTFIMGLGAGMQARGKIRGAYRITASFYDDIYSENNTITEESRGKIKRWFNNSSKNSVDTLVGKIFLVGTIVHDDTVLVEAEHSKTWRTLKFYPMPIIKFKRFIKEYLNTDYDKDQCIMPFEDEGDDFIRIARQEKYFAKIQTEYNWELTWPDRIDLYTLAMKYKEAVDIQAIAGFYQEYFHITIPEELRKFSPQYFQVLPEWHITHEYGYTWFHCKDWYDQPKIMYTYLGMDVAGGKEEGDNSAITVLGVLADGRYGVLEQSWGKYSMRDNVEADKFGRIDKILLDKEKVSKIGYIDELYRLAMKYHPMEIKIGEGGAENAIVVETRRIFMANQNYTNITPRPQVAHQGKKHERIKETLLPKYETMSVYHRRGLEQLEYELEWLTKAKNDDICESLEVAAFNTMRPIDVPYETFGRSTGVKKRVPILGYPTNVSNGWNENWRN